MKKFLSGTTGKVTIITIVALLILCVFLVKTSQDEQAADTAPAPADAIAEWTEGGIPVFVDFSADWCSYCKEMEPVIEVLRQEYAGKINFVTVDIDRQKKIAQAFGVSGVPAYLLIDPEGNPLGAHQGATDKATLEGLIDAALEENVP